MSKAGTLSETSPPVGMPWIYYGAGSLLPSIWPSGTTTGAIPVSPLVSYLDSSAKVLAVLF